MQLSRSRNFLVMTLVALLMLMVAGTALAQPVQVTIIDGPGAGTILTVSPVTPSPADPFVVGVVSGPGTIGAIEDHPGGSALGPHYHGTLNGLPDPNPTGSGWGHVTPFNPNGPPSNIFNFVEQFGVAGNVPGIALDGMGGGDDPLGFPDGIGAGPFEGPPPSQLIWLFNPDPAVPGNGLWSAQFPGFADPFTLDDDTFQDHVGGIGDFFIGDTTVKNDPPPAGNPPAGNTPSATTAPPTATGPAVPWTPGQGTPSQQQLKDETDLLKNMFDGYTKAAEYAKKHPDNKLAQENAEGLRTELQQQGNKVCAMNNQIAIAQVQAAAANTNTPQPTTPQTGTPGTGTPGTGTPGTGTPAPATPATGTPATIPTTPNNTSLNGQPMRPDQLPTVQALAAQFKGTQDLAGAAQAVFNTIGTSFVWSNDGDYMNGARTQNDLFSARQMACFEFVQWIGHLCGPQRIVESSGAPFAGSSAAGVKSLQNTSWDRSSVIPAGKIVLGVARAFNNNAGYYHVGISLGNGTVISLGGDSNLHIEKTADLFPRWAYSDVQVHDYNFFQQQGDRGARTTPGDDGSTPGTTPATTPGTAPVPPK